ncbi:F-box protein At3g07870-like [Salvia splendens]|uniref:F-box protein At3g07870-like n=1 Tax=Salvia splendens TaxID=180675 RepID=UPI001C2752F6|nr:F-box protein At3g07870-like [Salvia splendens]
MKITKRMMNKSAPIALALRRSKRILCFLSNLPQDIIRKILGRLLIRSIMRCKYVCKSWRSMIEGEGGDFGMLHTPQPGLAFVHRDMGFEVCDEACEPLCHFDFPPPLKIYSTTYLLRVVVGSTNGLILVCGIDARLCVCNPITSEYIKLPLQPADSHVVGFGVSKLSGQYKIICGAHVYTLGRGGGCWRGIVGATGRLRLPWENAVFFNGNLHWLTIDSKENTLVCCFDLETELYSNFSLPPPDHIIYDDGYPLYLNGGYQLCVLDGRLCLCDIVQPCRTVIWQMNTYGDANSWVKAYAVGDIIGIILPLKVFANGDLLFAKSDDDQLYIYSKKTERHVKNAHLRQYKSYFYNIVTYIPSFLSLTAMGIPNVQSLSFY